MYERTEQQEHQGVGMGRGEVERAADIAAPTAQQAREAWAVEAYSILVGVAQTYHAVITYKELGKEIQDRTGIRTKALLHNWIGPILGQVVREANRRGDPPLTALVVHTDDGKVGSGYKEVLAVAGEPPVEDELEREHHAAEARLACYRHFRATLPPHGGVPALAPRLQANIERRRDRTEKPLRVCERCFVQLPSTGICDSCS
ncbi:hypothetical protein ACWCXL_12710 [Streptomyces sp. NPDC001588]